MEENRKLKEEIAQSALIVRYGSAEVSSLAPNSSEYVSINVPPIEGYAAVLGIYASNNASSNIFPFLMSAAPQGDGVLKMGIKNISSGTIANITVGVYILYVKS